jgi:hypothetical protein
MTIAKLTIYIEASLLEQIRVEFFLREYINNTLNTFIKNS